MLPPLTISLPPSCIRPPVRSRRAEWSRKVDHAQGEQSPVATNPLDTGGGRVFSLDACFGFLANASAWALAIFIGSALSWYGVGCMI